MAALSTIALTVGAAAALGGAGYSAYSGERANAMQKRARRDQGQAQDQALAQAATQQRQAEEANRAANRRTPDINGLLLGEADTARLGSASTMLTGPRGLGDMKLRRQPSLLGD